MHADHIEREINHQLRARDEQTGTPERRTERKTPFGRSERRIQLPNLKESQRPCRSPSGTTAKQTYRPASRSRCAH